MPEKSSIVTIAPAPLTNSDIFSVIKPFLKVHDLLTLRAICTDLNKWVIEDFDIVALSHTNPLIAKLIFFKILHAYINNKDDFILRIYLMRKGMCQFPSRIAKSLAAKAVIKIPVAPFLIGGDTLSSMKSSLNTHLTAVIDNQIEGAYLTASNFNYLKLWNVRLSAIDVVLLGFSALAIVMFIKNHLQLQGAQNIYPVSLNIGCNTINYRDESSTHCAFQIRCGGIDNSSSIFNASGISWLTAEKLCTTIMCNFTGVYYTAFTGNASRVWAYCESAANEIAVLLAEILSLLLLVFTALKLIYLLVSFAKGLSFKEDYYYLSDSFKAQAISSDSGKSKMHSLWKNACAFFHKKPRVVDESAPILVISTRQDDIATPLLSHESVNYGVFV